MTRRKPPTKTKSLATFLLDRSVVRNSEQAVAVIVTVMFIDYMKYMKLQIKIFTAKAGTQSKHIVQFQSSCIR